MTIEELRWFVVLAETEHMTDSAAELQITQPTLSRALTRLEHRVGAPLFDRDGRRLRLNRFGAVLLEHARRALAEVDAAGDRIAELIDPERGTVRLAFLHSVATWLVPDLIRSFRAAAPGVAFTLHQDPGHDLLQALRDGAADLAVTSPRPEEAEFAWRPLVREQLFLAVPAGHRLADRPGGGRVRLRSAAEEPFVTLRPEFGFRRLTERLCAAAGFRARVAFEGTELATVEGMVAAGLGVAVLPELHAAAVPADRTAVRVPLADAGAHRTIGLSWLRDRPMPAVAERFRLFVLSEHGIDREDPNVIQH
ncbi:LysR family transcriptional regulator [Mangrovactinospora gilvigrisea]|uniref:LysR family transcriptional regulator n=1 Tax=Mangrovactinospora gilvigrisea TaxID=1428644 RepID=A0A1J7BCG7_9ACTN|nr:LysR family transcriptional regulator [Mangrovactinospora gilvigrisea]OIV36342.1 LysR family transcriptional regulator [Mangrovactinospora gilvigrisea]